MPDRRRSSSAAQLDAQFQVLRAIYANPSLSQRELSRQLGISLGKANYCVQALVDKGWIKTRNFKNHNNKIAYAYALTPKGIEQKHNLAKAFLTAKQSEFEILSQEIEKLKQETLDSK